MRRQRWTYPSTPRMEDHMKTVITRKTIKREQMYPLDRESDLFDFFLEQGYLPRLATRETNEWLFSPAYIGEEALRTLSEDDVEGGIRPENVQPHERFGLFVSKNADGKFRVKFSIDDWDPQRQCYNLRQKQGIMDIGMLKMFVRIHDDISENFYTVYGALTWPETERER